MSDQHSRRRRRSQSLEEENENTSAALDQAAGPPDPYTSPMRAEKRRRTFKSPELEDLHTPYLELMQTPGAGRSQELTPGEEQRVDLSPLGSPHNALEDRSVQLDLPHMSPLPVADNGVGFGFSAIGEHHTSPVTIGTTSQRVSLGKEEEAYPAHDELDDDRQRKFKDAHPGIPQATNEELEDWEDLGIAPDHKAAAQKAREGIADQRIDEIGNAVNEDRVANEMNLRSAADQQRLMDEMASAKSSRISAAQEAKITVLEEELRQAREALEIEKQKRISLEATRIEQDASLPEEKDKSSNDALQEALQRQQAEQQELKALVDSLKNDTATNQQNILEAIRNSSQEQIPFNVDKYLDEFSMALAQEVRMLLAEVGRLREERRGLQYEIGFLLTTRSKYGPGGEFQADWRPTTGPLAPHPPPEGPPSPPM